MSIIFFSNKFLITTSFVYIANIRQIGLKFWNKLLFYKLFFTERETCLRDRAGNTISFHGYLSQRTGTQKHAG